eukprot:gnl/TRDRNA2_/TRDRNA2_153269_c0_seq1.p1 gnl/TRDRNA2_/TRDRNA2_153269_c0~~gnl/TRDRNA2_/TRDRNA2_153269_c0_seq1.p1  ORF type:complete len:363 (+),score=77.27 gnl/TRDRNA2_/TRDRNA2_153269_c0_seq1:87-1091(+)
MGASGLASAAAFSHELLADEVSKMSDENDEYENSNKEMQNKVTELGGVADRMKSEAQSLQGGMDAFYKVLSNLHRQVALSELDAILNAFLQADGGDYGNQDKRLQGDEVDDFLSSCNNTLKQACPQFDIEAFKAHAKRQGGLGLREIKMIIQAVVNDMNDDSDSGKVNTKSMLELAQFGLVPKDNKNKDKLDRSFGDMREHERKELTLKEKVSNDLKLKKIAQETTMRYNTQQPTVTYAAPVVDKKALAEHKEMHVRHKVANANIRDGSFASMTKRIADSADVMAPASDKLLHPMREYVQEQAKSSINRKHERDGAQATSHHGFMSLCSALRIK